MVTSWFQFCNNLCTISLSGGEIDVKKILKKFCCFEISSALCSIYNEWSLTKTSRACLFRLVPCWVSPHFKRTGSDEDCSFPRRRLNLMDVVCFTDCHHDHLYYTHSVQVCFHLLWAKFVCQTVFDNCRHFIVVQATLLYKLVFSKLSIWFLFFIFLGKL